MKKITFITALFLSSAGAWGQNYGIETPDMNVVYAGIPSSFTGGACGNYKNITVSPSTITASQSQIGSYVTINVSAKDDKGQNVSLAGRKFLVKPTPKPELFWNGVQDGGKGNKNGGSLTCAFGNNVPFGPWLGNFIITSYTITMDGMKGSLEGTGSSISSAHLNVLKSITEGKVTISVKYSGTAEGRVTAMFQI
jgi:hypothetical protein